MNSFEYSSDVSSLLTRGSSVCSTETSLITPSDELSSIKFSPIRRNNACSVDDLATKQVVGADHAPLKDTPTQDTLLRDDNYDIPSQLPPVRTTNATSNIPPSPPPKFPPLTTTTIHQRRSAKDLIGIYESNERSKNFPTKPPLNARFHKHSVSVSSLQPSFHPPPPSNISRPRSESLTTPSWKDKIRKDPPSPIRNGIQNILGVFGRRKERQGSSEFTVIRATPADRKRPLPHLHTGQLVYLSHDSTPLDTWQHVSAQIFPPYLRLSFSRPIPGTPLTHSINLSQCTEVHSVPMNQIESGTAPLVQGLEDVYVFDMELEGGQRERFAAASIKERGSWVSSIWEVILKWRNTESVALPESPVTIDGRLNPPLHVVNVSHITTLSGKTTPAPSIRVVSNARSTLSLLSEASPLLQMPKAPPPTPNTSDTSSLLDLYTSSTRSESETQSTSSSLPTSSSIQRLDGQSLVKQRLAGIRRQYGDGNVAKSDVLFPSRSPSKHASQYGDQEGSATPGTPGSSAGARSGILTPPASSLELVETSSFSSASKPRKRRTSSSMSRHSLQSNPIPSSVSPSKHSSFNSFSSDKKMTLSNGELLLQKSEGFDTIPQRMPLIGGITLRDGEPGDDSWRVSTPKGLGINTSSPLLPTTTRVLPISPTLSTSIYSPRYGPTLSDDSASLLPISTTKSKFSYHSDQDASASVAHAGLQPPFDASRAQLASHSEMLAEPSYDLPLQATREEELLPAPPSGDGITEIHSPRPQSFSDLSHFSFHAEDDADLPSAVPDLAVPSSLAHTSVPTLGHTLHSPVDPTHPVDVDSANIIALATVPGRSSAIRCQRDGDDGHSKMSLARDAASVATSFAASLKGDDTASNAMVFNELTRLHEKLDVLSLIIPPQESSQAAEDAMLLHQKLDNLKEGLDGLEGAALADRLESIKEQLTELAEREQHPSPPLPPPEKTPSMLSMRNLPPTPVPAPPPVNLTPVLEKLEEIRLQTLAKDVPFEDANSSLPSAEMALVLDRLEELHAMQEMRVRVSQIRLEEREGPSAEDILAMHEKLDSLMQLCQSLTARTPPAAAPEEDVDPPGEGKVLSVFSRRRSMKSVKSADVAASSLEENEKAVKEEPLLPPLPAVPSEIQEVLSILQEEKTLRETQAQQQLDSVRYLNELNSWLERFVAQHTSQTQALTQGVNELIGSLKLPSAAPVPGGDGTPPVPPPPSLAEIVSDVHRLLTEQRDSVNPGLHASLEGIGKRLEEVVAHMAAERQGLATDAMVRALFEQQRQEHVQLVQALAANLSEEIRGERIRFIEAMKEATTVNLQNQIAEFKKHLTSEVIGMTESELADMFAMRYLIKTQLNSVPKPPDNL